MVSYGYQGGGWGVGLGGINVLDMHLTYILRYEILFVAHICCTCCRMVVKEVGGVLTSLTYTSLTPLLRYETFVRCTYTLHMVSYGYQQGAVKRGDSVLFKDQLWRLPRRCALFTPARSQSKSTW